MNLRWPSQFCPFPSRKVLKLRGGGEDSSKTKKHTILHTAPPPGADSAGGLPPPFGNTTGGWPVLLPSEFGKSLVSRLGWALPHTGKRRTVGDWSLVGQHSPHYRGIPGGHKDWRDSILVGPRELKKMSVGLGVVLAPRGRVSKYRGMGRGVPTRIQWARRCSYSDSLCRVEKATERRHTCFSQTWKVQGVAAHFCSRPHPTPSASPPLSRN